MLLFYKLDIGLLTAGSLKTKKVLFAPQPKDLDHIL